MPEHKDTTGRNIWLFKDPKKHTKAELMRIIETLTSQKVGDGWVMMPMKDFKHLRSHCDCFRVGT